MIPALEYLIRTNQIKHWFKPPCSLFLNHRMTGEGLVVTICDGFNKKDDHFSVKHWNLATCTKEQVLPHFTEYRVPPGSIFSHPKVILEDHRLLRYFSDAIPAELNTYRSPMAEETYQFFFNNILHSVKHYSRKKNWLWKHFVAVQADDLCDLLRYIRTEFRSDAEVAEEQREIAAKYKPGIWQFWQKWCKYLLFPDSIPGELIFSREYK